MYVPSDHNWAKTKAQPELANRTSFLVWQYCLSQNLPPFGAVQIQFSIEAQQFNTTVVRQS